MSNAEHGGSGGSGAREQPEPQAEPTVRAHRYEIELLAKVVFCGGLYRAGFFIAQHTVKKI